MKKERLEWHTMKEWEEIEKDPNVERITFFGALRLKKKGE
jgi:hypothetical protein